MGAPRAGAWNSQGGNGKERGRGVAPHGAGRPPRRRGPCAGTRGDRPATVRTRTVCGNVRGQAGRCGDADRVCGHAGTGRLPCGCGPCVGTCGDRPATVGTRTVCGDMRGHAGTGRHADRVWGHGAVHGSGGKETPVTLRGAAPMGLQVCAKWPACPLRDPQLGRGRSPRSEPENCHP